MALRVLLGVGRELSAAGPAGDCRGACRPDGHAIDDHLDRMAALDQADRRNGSCRRHFLTELGEIERSMPRTRRFAPIADQPTVKADLQAVIDAKTLPRARSAARRLPTIGKPTTPRRRRSPPVRRS